MALNIQEYAESMGISTQAVYSSLKRYKNELNGHITNGYNHKNQKTKVLDEFAINFLNEHRDKRTHTAKSVYENDNKNYLMLREQVATLQNALLTKQDEYIKEQEQHLQDVKDLNEEIKKLQQRVIELQSAAGQEPPIQKGFWERLFK